MANTYVGIDVSQHQIDLAGRGAEEVDGLPVSRTYANPIPIDSIGQTGCLAGTSPTVRTPSPVPVLPVSMTLSLPASALRTGRLPVTRVCQPQACGPVSAVGLAIAEAGAWLLPPAGGRGTRAVPPGSRQTLGAAVVGGGGSDDGTSCVLWAGKSPVAPELSDSQGFQRTVTNPALTFGSGTGLSATRVRRCRCGTGLEWYSRPTRPC